MEEEKKYCIYMHKNTINGKVYVGQTCQKPEDRWGKDGRNYLKKDETGKYVFKHFGPAIKKYGWDNFEHTILYENLSKEEADKIEDKLIIEYKTRDKKFGYNCKGGGAHGTPSEESKKLMSLSHIGKNLGAEHPCSKAVICLETREIYYSMFEAERKLNIGNKAVSSCINNKQKTANGLHWILLEEYNKMSEEEIQQYIQERQYYNKEVRCLETNEVYQNAAQAGRILKIKNVGACCRGERTKAGELHWIFEEDFQKMSKQEQEEYTKQATKKRIKTSREVLCLETNEIYASPIEAAKVSGTGCNSKDIGHICNVSKGHYSTRGFHWIYVDDYNKLSQDEKDKLLWHVNNSHKIIICVETQKIYNSYVEAQKDTGIDAWTINKCCRKKLKSAGGLHWELHNKNKE